MLFNYFSLSSFLYSQWFRCISSASRDIFISSKENARDIIISIRLITKKNIPSKSTWKNRKNIETTHKSRLATPKYCIFFIYRILFCRFFIWFIWYSSVVHTSICLTMEANARNLFVYASRSSETDGKRTAGVVISRFILILLSSEIFSILYHIFGYFRKKWKCKADFDNSALHLFWFIYLYVYYMRKNDNLSYHSCSHHVSSLFLPQMRLQELPLLTQLLLTYFPSPFRTN